MLPSTDLSVLHLGPLSVPTQGAVSVLGVGLGVTLFVRRLGHPRAELLATLAVVGALLGGHTLGMWLAPAPDGWNDISAQQSSLGALMGAALVMLLLAPRWGLPLPEVTDAAAWSFLHGWPLVRLGCALVHDHVGRLSTSPLAVHVAGQDRLDVGAVEALGTLVLLAIVRLWTTRRSLPVLRLAAATAWGFASLRLLVEVLRQDALAAVLESRANVASVVLSGIGLGLGTWLWRKSTSLAQLHGWT